ncbi:hypothetical protein VOI54_07150 [Tamlana sp. 2201CG12-4]|uniref:hypothetical protein n=1 Tax=Tamlana sp. 2201CG12-4 TaxID=3112582 RepID=UPI002DB55BE8|nr:hypothetical protein [Tamlana sp. 2201CG12-4]MEC3906790.1 hypothetical protein [Tamlana sp. 2201CG12-4]
MKTGFITMIGGVSILVLTSVGIKKDGELLHKNFEIEGQYTLENNEMEKARYTTEFRDIDEEDSILEVEDIKLYQIEEEVNFGFDTTQHLPMDFNPYQGLNSKEEIDFEEKLVFEMVFNDGTEEEIVEIEEVIVYEIDNTI